MARHDQKVKKEHMRCRPCSLGNCNRCVDIFRAIYDRSPICTCTRSSHGGEPRDQQVLDPETGTVHAPGLTVSEGGEVNKRCVYEPRWTDEAGEVEVCMVHGTNSKHSKEQGQHRPCLAIDPWEVPSV